MGIDIHTLKFLMYETKTRPLGRVATLGRQRIDLPAYWLKRMMNLSAEPSYGTFCEELLKDKFGATLVESFDNSNYENATHVVDMNRPIAVEKTYDTVIDGGTLEHVFNVPQALWNISTLCADGGRILHILPANNYCGHGFWQFSPELFFSLYSEANGYAETKVFLAALSDWNAWYECRKPREGSRAEFRSIGSAPLLLLVSTDKPGRFSHANIQQSDYVEAWNQADVSHQLGPTEPKLTDRIKNSPFWQVARQGAYRLRRLRSSPHMIKRKTRTLTGRP
jgi:hypothetical protein